MIYPQKRVISFSVFDGAPRNKQQIDATSGGMGGEARKEANKTKVFYGLLKEPELNNIRFEEDEEEKEGDETSKPKVICFTHALNEGNMLFGNHITK